MKFNLKNYPNFKPLEYEQESLENSGVPLNANLKAIKTPLPLIIKDLNTNKILNIQSQEEIPIIFENFSWFGKIKTFLKDIVFRENNYSIKSNIAHYEYTTESIHIFNTIIKPKIDNQNYRKSYKTLIDKINDHQFLINFFVLHEIGHAIHDKIILKQNYNNLTDYFKENTNNLLHNANTLIVRENFADMFAGISLFMLDKNNANYINNMAALSQFRKDVKQENYYTFNNLDLLIEDCKNNNISFKTNKDVLAYINQKTNVELKLRLMETLSNTLNSQEHNKQLGYLASLFKIKDDSVDGIIQHLKTEIDYQQPKSYFYEKEDFELGKTSFNKPNIIKKIEEMRQNFASNIKNSTQQYKF